MFSNLIQSYSSKTTQQERQAAVRSAIDQIQSSDLPSIQQQLHSQYQEVLNILKNHSQITVELIFSKITVEDCIRLMKSSQDNEIQSTKQNGLLRLLNDIGKNTDPQKDQIFIEWFSKMYTKYSSIEKVVIFMRQLVHNYVEKFSQKFLPQFFADFISGSRVVIETYLKLKVQAPKFEYEYMEHGDYITKWTETWLKGFYVRVLENIAVPESSQVKLAVLNGVCDIIGAVMDVQREGNIEFKICSQILSACFGYVKKLTTLNEFNQMYLHKLRSNGFNIPNHKIIIPNRYPSNTITFPKQSYSFIVFHFLKESLEIYSDQLILNHLVPVINQLAQFEYQIKNEIETLFVEKLTSNQTQIKTCFQGNFPLSIVYFNTWYYQEKRNKVILFGLDKTFEKIKLQSPGTFVNNLKILSNLHIEDLSNEINQFIGTKALQVAGTNPELLVGLIKNMRWVNTNEKGETVWRQVMSQIGKKPEVREQIERILGQRQEKNKFENQLFKVVSE